MGRSHPGSQSRRGTFERLQTRGAAAVAAARRLRWRAARFARWLGASLIAASFIVAVLLLAGTAMGIGGVYLLFGTGWALLASCGFTFALAALIARGGHE